MNPTRFSLSVLAGLLFAGRLQAADAQLTLDLGRPGAAISPYLYGQFIEHLGRCIHDGVWAEKLRDRKFLLAPTNSPWQIVKAAEAMFDVVHDPAGAYAGDHSLALWLRGNAGGPCGIRQDRIGLIAGKEYVGYVVLANAGASGAPVEVRLTWGDGPSDGETVTLKKVGRAYRKFPFRFRAASTTDGGSLFLTFSQPAHLWVACLSLMPADNIKGMRRDTLELIKKLNPPITRWPGGNFVSGYNWKDALGDRDRRPPRWERAWNDVEDNDFGLDEFMTFCTEVRTEPYVAVNTGLGSALDAADEVEYATGSTRTRWGAERARNGHAKPYRVNWWGVGNEMYGDWQLGSVPVERYAIRHNAFVAAMKARSPGIKIIAVGAPGKWNDAVLSRCAGSMDLLSGHHYTERRLRVPFTPEDAAKFARSFPAYSDDVAAGVRRLVTDFRNRLGQGAIELDRVRLAIDEWGIVRDWNSTPDGPGIGAFEHYYTLGDAIAAGRALHELLRSADVVSMANWAQTVNVIGTVKTSRNHAVLDPAGHLLALYRAQIGGSLVPVSLGAVEAKVRLPVLGSVQVRGTEPIDCLAAWNRKTRVLAVGLINFSPDREVTIAWHVAGLLTAKAGKAWRLNGPDLGATNVPGQPEAVTTVGLPQGVSLGQPMFLPAHSITVVRFEGVRTK